MKERKGFFSHSTALFDIVPEELSENPKPEGPVLSDTKQKDNKK